MAVGAVAPATSGHGVEGPLGRHVLQCAIEGLGGRPDPPTIMCEHEGHVHVFATFGEMVRHVLESGNRAAILPAQIERVLPEHATPAA